MMKTTFHTIFCLAFLLLSPADGRASAEAPTPGAWSLALPGWQYRFPADHAIHPDYKTEWWYFTGNVVTADRKEYGYELTFFRQGVLPPGQRRAPVQDERGRSRFVQGDFKFAHFAITDLGGGQFHYTQKSSRGAFGEAGFGSPEQAAKPFVWLENWQLASEPDGSWRVTARAAEPVPMQIDLLVASQKPPVIEGTDGVSQKSTGLGNASHYYSFTRLATRGTLAVGTEMKAQLVTGESWFDHEWASNQLGTDQIGWNWFCIQLDDQTELMLYAMRRKDGTVDPVSSGTYIDAQGVTTHLRFEDFQLQPLRTWHSLKTDATYPLSWHVTVPSQAIDTTVSARLDDQELALPQISYWEGVTAISGTRAGRRLIGHGYMELTGYTGALAGLKAKDPAGESSLRTSPR